MIKQRTLSEIFGGQVWNTGEAIFPLVRHTPHQLNSEKCPDNHIANISTFNICLQLCC